MGRLEAVLRIRRKRAGSITNVLTYRPDYMGAIETFFVAKINEIILQTGMGPYRGGRLGTRTTLSARTGCE